MRIIVFFTVGQERKRCRLVLGTELGERAVEVLDHDKLGDPRWVQAKNMVSGPIDVSLLIERALVHVLTGLTTSSHPEGVYHEANWPRDVKHTERGLEIELGAFK